MSDELRDDLKTILDKMKVVQKYPDLYDDETREKVIKIGERALEVLKEEYPGDEEVLKALGLPRIRRSRYPNSAVIAGDLLEKEEDDGDGGV